MIESESSHAVRTEPFACILARYQTSLLPVPSVDGLLRVPFFRAVVLVEVKCGAAPLQAYLPDNMWALHYLTHLEAYRQVPVVFTAKYYAGG